MFGKNPIRKPLKGDGSQLKVVNIFPTIQGEGPNVGQPAIFIRLGGCNLACKFCDTEFEDFKTMSLEGITSEVQQIKNTEKLIVITGGEPLRQPIEKLCEELISAGFKVQIETNGTLFRPLPEEVEIICSPKTKHLHGDLIPRISAYKYLISKFHDDYAEIPTPPSDAPIYIQPIDEYDTEKNAQNMELAKTTAMDNGHNLSIQMHKVIGAE